jgi:hypothetical protein
MREMIDWIAAEAERVEGSAEVRQRGRFSHEGIEDLPAHAFPGRGSELTTEGTEGHGGRQSRDSRQDDGAMQESQNPHPFDKLRAGSVAENATRVGHPEIESSNAAEGAGIRELSWEEERERRIYRARTVTMLRRYMRYSIETGRLPSLLGREFFRTQVTSYTVVTFEDRVIFVHDMETCLNKLDEFSRQIIARHILQEHDQEATARLLHCTDRTVRTYVPIALDLMTEILLDVGLLERIVPIREKSCQGAKTGENFVSGCEESKNKL